MPEHGDNTMKIHRSITLERLTEAIEADDCLGFCLACGSEAFGVEPDAEEYECEECGEPEVYGAEQILFFIEA
jgi:hypothetical protein